MNRFSVTRKKIMFGNNRSKALNATKRNWKLNLQKYHFVDLDGSKKVCYLTVREIRTLKKQDRLKQPLIS